MKIEKKMKIEKEMTEKDTKTEKETKTEKKEMKMPRPSWPGTLRKRGICDKSRLFSHHKNFSAHERRNGTKEKTFQR